MKKVLNLVALICAILSMDVYSETITIEENMIWGNTYFVDGKKMEAWFLREELRKVVHKNPAAVNELDDSIVYGMSATLMMASGVIMIAEQVVDALAGNNPSVTIAFAGAGFIKLGAWLRDKKQEKYKKAIDLFNSGEGMQTGSGVNTGLGKDDGKNKDQGKRKITIPKGSKNSLLFDLSPRMLRLSLSFY